MHSFQKIGMGVQSRNFSYHYRANSHWPAGFQLFAMHPWLLPVFPLTNGSVCHWPPGLKALLSVELVLESRGKWRQRACHLGQRPPGDRGSLAELIERTKRYLHILDLKLDWLIGWDLNCLPSKFWPFSPVSSFLSMGRTAHLEDGCKTTRRTQK